jgi:hypothetical protein
LAALAGGAVPALAATTVPAPCVVSGDARAVELGSSAKPFETPGTPGYLSDITQELVLILPTGEGAPKLADVNITLSWPTPVSDFDMTVTGPDGIDQSSFATNVVEGNTETASVAAVGRCDSIMVNVQNFAGSPLEELTLTVDAIVAE